MLERWELVELIGQVLEERNLKASEETAEAILDEVAYLIRADERGRMKRELWPMIEAAEADVRTALHAKVEALPSVMDGNVELVVLAHVLALLDGSSE